MITDTYLNAAIYMVARQFIDPDDLPAFDNWEAFKERATYLMRQHCPIAYSYFFTHAPEGAVPHGTFAIIVIMVRKERPLFLTGVYQEG